MSNQKNSFSFGSDFPSSIVVFFVALPLCLGIAHGSTTPLLSGLIAGIVGGIIVGAMSGSRFGVSGPAAGLMSLVIGAMLSFEGDFNMFLVCVVLAGVIQILLGVFKLGFIADYFPNSVIQGMLAGIGVTIFVKQLPFAFGFNKVDELGKIAELSNFGPIIITVLSLGVLILFQQKFISQHRLLKFVPGSMVAVLLAVVLYFLFKGNGSLGLGKDQLVNLGGLEGPSDFFKNMEFPDFAAGLKNPTVWITALVIAIVASLETLLCVEATDKLDPDKNETPTNRELIAQGTGNIISGMIGGLPITQVIVRSSANINSGAKSKWSAVMHGGLLFLCVLFIPFVLILIPLAALAAVLLIVGFKLAHPQKFKKMYEDGWIQFIPFVVTVALVWQLGLLYGVAIGFVLAKIFEIANKKKAAKN
jgi:MFS superfamily sulfate permease-like transporter